MKLARRFRALGVKALRFGMFAQLAVALSGCAKKTPPELAKLVLAAPPADMPLKLGIELGNAIELVGAKVAPTQGLKPGSRVEVTLYWRKKADVDKGFRLFTHVLDEAGERILNLDGVGLLRKTSALEEPLYPPSDWREGEVYVDQLAFTLPMSVRTDSITLVCGLFRAAERLEITNRPSAQPQPTRALVAKLSVSRPLASAASAVPLLWLPHRLPDSPIKIDGKLDEAAWQRAATTGQLVNVGTGELPTGDEVSGSVKLTYDERSLYVGFDVFDDDLRGGFEPSEIDPHLWLKDTVELMVDPDGDGDNRDYYEIQVGPQNLVFDSEFDAYNLPHTEPRGPFGHQDWSAHLESAVELRGTLDDEHEDEGYVVELAIPWASFRKAKRVPPSVQDSWRMNFYVMQNNAGAAWSPILGQGNFHKASRFGRIRFAGPPSTKP